MVLREVPPPPTADLARLRTALHGPQTVRTKKKTFVHSLTGAQGETLCKLFLSF